MPDEADDAGHREEQARQEALGKRRPEAPPACGACLFCGEELRTGQRWCDQDCRDDWERYITRTRLVLAAVDLLAELKQT